jgi:hypothetical protein
MQLSSGAAHVSADLIKLVARVRDERKVWSLALHGLASHFDATAGALFLYKRSSGDLYKVKSIGDHRDLHHDTLLAFFHNRKPELAPETIMAPVRAGDLVVGVLALLREGAFRSGAGREATEILKRLGYWTGCRRQVSLERAECAIARTVIGRVRHKDIIYRILHQLRRFIDYDHGATVLLALDQGRGVVVARQVAWSKGRSEIVGRTVPFSWEDLPSISHPAVLTRSSSLWDPLSRLIETSAPQIQSSLVGPLAHGDKVVGLTAIGSVRPGFFLDNDTGILSRFLPYLAWCAGCIRDNPERTGGSHG